MRNILPFLVIIFCLSGCVTLKEAGPADQSVEKMKLETERVREIGLDRPEVLVQPGDVKPDTSPELQNIRGEELEGYAEKKGVVFAKTDFQGVLKSSYVKLLLEDRNDSTHKFQLHIGSKTGQAAFPWKVITVEPGYFFIELPVGQYIISSLSIPVGSTMANEEINISFEVNSDAISYIGTLKVVGTKEKIKLGGVPVIRPGFEYAAEIIDEKEEGIEAFRQRYPNFDTDILIKLMQLNTL